MNIEERSPLLLRYIKSPQALGIFGSWGFIFYITGPQTTFTQVQLINLGVNLSTASKYKCHSCGYSAEVLDQPETDMYYTVETKHCLGCKSLVTVAIKAHAASMIGGDGGGFSHHYRYLDECPDCSSKNTQDWDAKHSCPKCGEHMTIAQA